MFPLGVPGRGWDQDDELTVWLSRSVQRDRRTACVALSLFLSSPSSSSSTCDTGCSPNMSLFMLIFPVLIKIDTIKARHAEKSPGLDSPGVAGGAESWGSAVDIFREVLHISAHVVQTPPHDLQRNDGGGGQENENTYECTRLLLTPHELAFHAVE